MKSEGKIMAKKHIQINKSASIKTRYDRTGKLRTETTGRNAGVNVAVSTNERNDSTMLYVDFPDGSVAQFDGRSARTLFRVLSRHYDVQDKSL